MRKQLEQIISKQDLLASGQARLENSLARMQGDVGATLRDGFGKLPLEQVVLETPHDSCTPDLEASLIGQSPPALGALPLIQRDRLPPSLTDVSAASIQDAPFIKQISSTKSPSAAQQDKATFMRRKKRLERILEVNEHLETREVESNAAIQKKKSGGRLNEWLLMDRKEIENTIDNLMCVVISANAIFIGISLDYAGEGMNSFQITDITFTVIFLIELTLKLVLHGFYVHFCGKEKYTNIFDTTLIVLDSMQVFVKVIFPELAKALKDAGIPSASLFRIVRLVRLMRLMRLFRTELFKDLLAMLQGLFSGAFTLMWAIVLFLMMVYVAGLLCREFFGNDDVENVQFYFSTVPRAMFTIFRCSFGDCSAMGGVPIPEYITVAYGGGFAIGYCMFIFIMTIGLFNVISAIFVDSTMTAAATAAFRKRQRRLDDEHRWAGNVCTIIKELLAATPHHSINRSSLRTELGSLVEIEFTRQTMDDVINSEDDASLRVKACLDDLDIDPNDHKRLSDILDPDHSGTIGVLELVEGLRRLRGEPRRSDVVTVDLMVRTMQERVEEVVERLVELKYIQEKKVEVAVRRYYDV
jgi:hypothetical protein